MLLLRMNVAVFAMTAGTYAAAVSVTGDLSVASIWGTALAVVVGINVGSWLRRGRDDTERTVAEMAELRTSLAWGFVVALLTFPALVTYNEISGTTVGADGGLVVAAGIVTTMALALGYELRRRFGGSSGSR